MGGEEGEGREVALELLFGEKRVDLVMAGAANQGDLLAFAGRGEAAGAFVGVSGA